MKSIDTQRPVLFVFLLFFSLSLSAQLIQGKRIEFERNNNIEEDHQIFSLDENGVLLFHATQDAYRRKGTIDFYKYDSTLTEIWKATYLPEEDFELVKTFQNDRFLFILFKKHDRTDIGVLRLDFETGDKLYVDGNLLTNMDIEHFGVLESKAFIGGKYNDRPVVVMFSFFDKSSKVLPEIHANHMVINEIDINIPNELIYVMLKNERNCQFTLKTYSYEGKLLNVVAVGDKQKTPITGKILNTDKGNAILLGNYAEGCSPLSIGIYVQNLSNDSKIQYIDFSDLNNFFSFMNPKREEKMLSRIKLRKQKGKEVKLRNRLLLHDIISTSEGWVMVAEIFYPEYKAPTVNGSLSNWRNYRIGNDVYNNFRYTHAILCGFDHNGKLLWDNSISLKDVESNELNPKVQITRQNDFHIVAYPDEELIRTVVLKDSEKVKNLETFDLKANTETEKITNTERTNLVAWYGHSFLAYGYQSIRRENLVSNREVFSISKLTYSLKDGKQ